MLLQRLKEYADERMELPPTLYTAVPVRYLIEIDLDGRLLNPAPVDTADPSSPTTRRGTRRFAPQIQRSSGIKPLLLADKADYVLGYVAGPRRRGIQYAVASGGHVTAAAEYWIIRLRG